VPRTTSGKTERYRCRALLDDAAVLLYIWTPGSALDGARRRVAS
jgi:hypothetical protein